MIKTLKSLQEDVVLCSITIFKQYRCKLQVADILCIIVNITMKNFTSS